MLLNSTPRWATGAQYTWETMGDNGEYASYSTKEVRELGSLSTNSHLPLVEGCFWVCWGRGALALYIEAERTPAVRVAGNRWVST